MENQEQQKNQDENIEVKKIEVDTSIFNEFDEDILKENQEQQKNQDEKPRLDFEDILTKLVGSLENIKKDRLDDTDAELNPLAKKGFVFCANEELADTLENFDFKKYSKAGLILCGSWLVFDSIGIEKIKDGLKSLKNLGIKKYLEIKEGQKDE